MEFFCDNHLLYFMYLNFVILYDMSMRSKIRNSLCRICGFMSHNMIINVLYLFKMLPVLIVGAWCLDVG